MQAIRQEKHFAVLLWFTALIIPFTHLKNVLKQKISSANWGAKPPNFLASYIPYKRFYTLFLAGCSGL
jgi:hypothetical protein